jgi:class 3 adenylate cyclase
MPADPRKPEPYHQVMGRGPSSTSLACVECGAGLPSAAKFCPECGTPVSPTGRDSRRTVTLLFTDVTGSTAMGEQRDPEAYRDVMGRYFAVARAAVERHGGTVEKFVGDAVLAVFGIPEVHEDDALRAVRAARELNDAVAGLGLGLTIRTGVNTGAVVAGSARAGGSFATGDAVNTAARLEQAAGDGEILLGATTYALIRDAVEVEAIEGVLAKGKAEPVPAYRLLRVLDVSHGRRRREDVPLVGRTQENRALDDALERTMTSGHGHLVTVLGPPGIGKSRLVSEFLTRVGDRAEVAQGRCVSYGQGIAYWPLVQALRHPLRLSGTESDEITRHALEQALGEVPDRERVVVALLPLLGKTGNPGSSEQTVWSVRRLLEELASRQPLVLSVDDLHWAEPTLLDLLEQVRDVISDLPLLMLCQARPELLEQRPEWGSGAQNSMMFGLEPLSAAEIDVSITGLLGGRAPQGFAETVATWSGGNPLFIEEIVAHLTESGMVQRADDGRWQLAGGLERAELPPTVSALLAARLGRLPPAELELLGRLSVIGLEFTSDDADLLAEPSASPGTAGLLSALTRRDLVRRVRSTQGGSWAFKHILVRDAAYDGLAKSVRAGLHERFADGLTALGASEGAGELEGFIAHHLEQAARYRRELAAHGPEIEALVDRAVAALILAARQARDGDRLMDHGAHLQRALQLEPRDPAIRRQILEGLVDHHMDESQMDQLGEVLDAFEAELDDSSDDLDRTFLRATRLWRRMNQGDVIDPAEVAAAAQELVSLGRSVPDATAVVRGLRMVSISSEMLGLWSDAAAVSDEVIQIGSTADAREVRDTRFRALFLGAGTFRECLDLKRREAEAFGASDFQGWVEMMIGALVEAADRSSDAARAISTAVARGEELFSAGKVSEPTHAWLLEAFALNRDLDGAIAYAQRENDGFRRAGALAYASTYILQQALLMLDRGDASEAVLPLVEEAAEYTSPYDAASVCLLAACRAILAVRAGDGDEAMALTTEAIRAIDRTQQVWQQADARRYLSGVARATGDSVLERRMLEDASAMYARKEIRSYPEIDARLAELAEEEA